MGQRLGAENTENRDNREELVGGLSRTSVRYISFVHYSGELELYFSLNALIF